MSRAPVAVFALVTTSLVVAASACSSGSASPVSTTQSAGALATAERRTAVADVQRIIANNPTATALPTSTATERPTCSGAIWWSEARAHLGEQRTVQGKIVGTRPAPNGAALLEMGQPYPDPTGLAVLVPSPPLTALDGKTVCVAGRIADAEGGPAIQLSDASSITVVD